MEADRGRQLEGVFPILHTPFDHDGTVSYSSLASEVEFCVASGVGGVVFPSLASEFYSLTDEERREITSHLGKMLDGSVPLVVGVTSVTGDRAATLAAHALDSGAEALLALPPYPRQASIAGVIKYFKEIAEAAPGVDIILQTPKPPAGPAIAGEDLAHLLDEVPSIRYIKAEDTPAGEQISALLSTVGERITGVFGGYFGLSQVLDAGRGACGCMPGVSLADIQVEIDKRVGQGQVREALALQMRIQGILDLLSSYPISGEKHLAAQRRIVGTAHLRDPQAVPLSATTKSEFDLVCNVAALSDLTAGSGKYKWTPGG